MEAEFVRWDRRKMTHSQSLKGVDGMMGQAFRKLFDAFFGNKEMRVGLIFFLPSLFHSFCDCILIYDAIFIMIGFVHVIGASPVCFVLICY